MEEKWKDKYPDQYASELLMLTEACDIDTEADTLYMYKVLSNCVIHLQVTCK